MSDIAEIRKMLNKITKEMAEELTAAIENAYESAIAAFYYHYTPVEYDRTYSTFLASDHYNGYNNVLKASFDAGNAGIKLDDRMIHRLAHADDMILPGSSNSLYGRAMPVNHRKRIKVQRSGRGYIAGITVSANNIPGNPYYDHWGMNRGEVMDTEWVFDRTFERGIHGFTSREIPKALKGYNVTKSGPQIKDWVPRVMHPSPYHRTRVAFNKLTSKKSLSNMATRYIEKYVNALNNA